MACYLSLDDDFPTHLLEIMGGMQSSTRMFKTQFLWHFRADAEDREPKAHKKVEGRDVPELRTKVAMCPVILSLLIMFLSLGAESVRGKKRNAA